MPHVFLPQDPGIISTVVFPLKVFKATTTIPTLGGHRISVPNMSSIQEPKHLKQLGHRVWLPTVSLTSGSAFLLHSLKNAAVT
jgi:hypothetical protein